MAKTYTVKWGDTLSQIAVDNNTTYQTLAKINGISNPDYIVVGQVIKLSADSSSTSKVTTAKVKINAFGLAPSSTTGRDVRVTWSWDRANTKEYSVEWSQYYDNYWHYTTNTTTDKGASFTANDAATSVRVRVKPVSKTYTNSKGKEVTYWSNVNWTSRQTYSFSNNPPQKPSSAPNVDIAQDKLTASLENLSDLNAKIIEFNLAKDGTPLSSSKKVKIDATHAASVEITVDLGSKYKARARAWKNEKCSAWSDWTSEYSTAPSKPVIDKCMPGATDSTIEVYWNAVNSATGYIIQYASKAESLDNPTDKDPRYEHECSETQNKNCSAILSDNITNGLNYFVRVQAYNKEDNSDTRRYSEWSEHHTASTENGPLAPTSFTDKVVYEVGKVITLSWVHNQRVDTDTSESTNTNTNNTTKVYAKYSQIDLYIDNGEGAGFVRTLIPTLKHVKDDGTTVEKIDQHTYSIYVASEVDEDNTSDYDIVCPDGCTIKWRVRTAGEDGIFGEWSALRTFAVYAAPTLELVDSSGTTLTSESTITLSSFPLKVEAYTGPDVQIPIGYHVEIKSGADYEVTDEYGDSLVILEGDVVYSQNFDDVSTNQFTIQLSAGDVNLVNDMNYTVTITVAMNSGLSVESSFTIVTTLVETNYIIDAEITIDEDSYTAMIRPYCEDISGNLVEDTLMYVYRREYNGSYTRISGDIDNLSETFVSDPHPALDYARYRIAAMNTATGQMHYADIPGVKVGCKSIILQWNEQWHNFDLDSEIEYSSWNGTMLKLPYNIDIQNRYSPDVALIEYIGRENPVGYYGTQRGESATWNVEIDKKDTDTIYALRRLARWMGDVYVREPSGTGYWANVSVSFNIKHKSLTIPVALGVTKVEGGM